MPLAACIWAAAAAAAAKQFVRCFQHLSFQRLQSSAAGDSCALSSLHIGLLHLQSNRQAVSAFDLQQLQGSAAIGCRAIGSLHCPADQAIWMWQIIMRTEACPGLESTAQRKTWRLRQAGKCSPVLLAGLACTLGLPGSGCVAFIAVAGGALRGGLLPAGALWRGSGLFAGASGAA